MHKKDDKKDCTNYRGISLLNTAYKILSLILLERLKPYTQEIVGEYQAGFKQNRSTNDQMYALRQIIEKRLEYNKNTHILFIDFRKAYDCLNRTAVFNALLLLGIPSKIVRMIETCMNRTKNKIRTNNGESNNFETRSGVKQGDSLSPIIFNLALHYALDTIDMEKTTWGIEQFQLLAYADDIAVMGETREEVEECLMRMKEGTCKIGLSINEEKTEYIVSDKDKNNRTDMITLDNKNYKVVEKFKYLGTQINVENSFLDEIKIRITNANKCYFSLGNIFKAKNVSRSSKIRLYKTVILPIVLYGSETWATTKQIENTLQSFENKVL